MQLYDMLTDTQPQSRSAALTGTSFIHSIKALKNVGQIFWRDPRAVILRPALNTSGRASELPGAATDICREEME